MLLILFKEQDFIEKQNLSCPIEIKRRTEDAEDIIEKARRVVTHADDELNL